MAVTIYLGHKMTGRSSNELLEESLNASFILNDPNILLLDPVIEEGVKINQGIILASEKDLNAFWKRDKELIKQSDVLLDLTGPEKSEGVAHEIGYARYCLWIPVIRYYPGLSQSVARIEDDLIVSNLNEARELILEKWGTYPKRLKWRIKMLLRCLSKWLFLQIKRMFQ